MRIDQTALPVSFRLLSASTVCSSSEKIGAIRGDFTVSHSSKVAYYFEISIEKLGSTMDSAYFCIGAVIPTFLNNEFPGSQSNSFGYSSNGRFYHCGDVMDWNNRFAAPNFAYAFSWNCDHSNALAAPILNILPLIIQWGYLWERGRCCWLRFLFAPRRNLLYKKREILRSCHDIIIGKGKTWYDSMCVYSR